MREDWAAVYVGLSVSTFRVEEKADEFHATWLTERRKVYLREHLDAYLDRKDGKLDGPAQPVDEMADWQKALDGDGRK